MSDKGEGADISGPRGIIDIDGGKAEDEDKGAGENEGGGRKGLVILLRSDRS